MWPMLGIAVLVVGFLLRLNPLLVVIGAAATSGLLAWHDPLHVLAAYGKAFNDNRLVAAVWLVLPVIGLLERYGLQNRARGLIAGVRRATVGRLLLIYFVYRQITAAVGLVSAGGHAQMVRPLVAPMAEAAVEQQTGATSDGLRALARAHAAAADNIGVFFGEDIFVGIGSVAVVVGFMRSSGTPVEPLQLAFWAIPTAIAALIVHGARLLLLDRQVRRMAAQA